MRTKNSLLNFATSFLPGLLIAILGFIKISVFIDIYGSEMNGLIQLVVQIFAYLGLMEMGFGSAINFKLYKPLAEQNYKKVSELFCGAKLIFRRIGLALLLGGGIAAIAAPFLISSTIEGLYISIIFILFTLDYQAQYMFGLAYQTLLTSDQKMYKINIIRATRNLAFGVIEILLILIGVNYIIVLVLGVITNFISNLFLIRSARKAYPWLDENAKKDTSTLGMTKDVLVHKLSGLVFNKTDAIVLSVFQGLAVTSIYSVYSFVITYLEKFINYIFTAVKDSVGNLFALSSSDENRVKIFKEINSIAILLAILIPVVLVSSFSNFILIWINNEYVLERITILLFGVNLMHTILIKPLHTFRNANGLYKETKKYTIAQTVMNLSLSIILAPIYGIKGVLIATVTSQILIANPFEVKMVYKNVIKENYLSYYKYYFTVILGSIILYSINNLFIDIFNLFNTNSLFIWALNSGVLFLLDFVIVALILYYTYIPFKNVSKRIKNIRK